MAQRQTKTIAFVTYPGLTPLDVVGPIQVLSTLQGIDPTYHVVSVGETLGPVGTDCPLNIAPTHTFGDVPSPWALVVPGGTTPMYRAMVNPALSAWLKRAAETAEYIFSVCTGALVLGANGLIEGRKATTHWAQSKQLERLGAHYLPERWVEDGNYISSAGVSAGIDMALYVVTRLAGEDVARQIQLAIEYDPQPPTGPIDWEHVDRNSVDAGVDRWITDALSDHPDLMNRLLNNPRC